MKIIILTAIGILSFSFLMTSLLEAQNNNNFIYEISTTQSEFFEGETIPLFMRIKNNSNRKDSIYSLGELKVLHNLYMVKENGDSTTGYQFSWDDGSTYTVFHPGQTIEFYNNDLSTYIPMSGGLFYTHIPAGNYKFRGYIPNKNETIRSNDLELTLKKNIGKAKDEFRTIKDVIKIYNEKYVGGTIMLEDFMDSVPVLYLEKYEDGKFFTKTVHNFNSFLLLRGYKMNRYLDLNLNAIKNSDISDSSYARMLTSSLYDFLGGNSEKYAYTQNDFKYFLMYNTEINPIIREQLIREIEGK